jgi:hypothetical protein
MSLNEEIQERKTGRFSLPSGEPLVIDIEV